jgi:hypothetical protein
MKRLEKIKLINIIEYSLSMYQDETDRAVLNTFCNFCHDRKPYCFPCPMSRLYGSNILPKIIESHSILN